MCYIKLAITTKGQRKEAFRRDYKVLPGPRGFLSLREEREERREIIELRREERREKREKERSGETSSLFATSRFAYRRFTALLFRKPLASRVIKLILNLPQDSSICCNANSN